MNYSTLKTKDFEKGSLEDLHHNSKYWLNEIAFWEDELEFMQQLLKRYFIHLMSKDAQHTLQALDNEIMTLETKQLSNLKKLVTQHESKLMKLVVQSTSKDLSEYRSEHEKLDAKIGQFETTLKLAKNELFRMAKEVLKDEKFQRLIAN